MVDPPSEHGDIVELKSVATAPREHCKRVLIEQEGLRVIQFVIPAGWGIPRYEAHGIIVLHCLQGWLSVMPRGRSLGLARLDPEAPLIGD